MNDDGTLDPAHPTGPEEQESRRAFLRRLAKRATYAAPVIYSFAAPTAATAQVSPGMMMTLCDYFPIICRLFGGDQATRTEGLESSPAQPRTPPSPPLREPPWSRPPPGGSAPGGGGPRIR